MRVVSAATVDTLAVHSPSMDRDVPVVAIVPEGVSAAEPCPVVYLLHGYSGDETAWLKIKPSLPAIADRERIAFICPGVGNSWYLDSKVREKSLYETFMIRELLPAVEARYPVVRDRSGRAITGLSMGGFGAMSLAIKHKGLFGAAGSTSGGLDIRPFPQNWEIPQLLGEITEHPEAWEEATPINLIPQLGNGDLAIVFDCGYDDFFFEVNNDFTTSCCAGASCTISMYAPVGIPVPIGAMPSTFRSYSSAISLRRLTDAADEGELETRDADLSAAGRAGELRCDARRV